MAEQCTKIVPRRAVPAGLQNVTHHIEAVCSKVLDDPVEPGHGAGRQVGVAPGGPRAGHCWETGAISHILAIWKPLVWVDQVGHDAAVRGDGAAEGVVALVAAEQSVKAERQPDGVEAQGLHAQCKCLQELRVCCDC